MAWLSLIWGRVNVAFTAYLYPILVAIGFAMGLYVSHIYSGYQKSNQATAIVKQIQKQEEYGWEYIPFLTPISVDGINYCHYFTSGVMGKPIGGEMPALSLIRKQLETCIQGHSHVLDFAHRTNANGRRVWGIHCGCYLDPNQWEEYAGQANKLWWKGAIVLRNVENGDFDIETISIAELERRYA